MSVDHRHFSIEKTRNANGNDGRRRRSPNSSRVADRDRPVDMSAQSSSTRARGFRSDHDLVGNIQRGEYEEVQAVHNYAGDEEPSFHLDKYNILLLLFLYVLQGIPLGLCAAVPMLLQNRGISYKEQAQFSLVVWPFSMKLLWAPIVDYLYAERWGRRKSWLIPTQYMIGAFMMLLSLGVDQWLTGEAAEGAPSIRMITLFFFGLNFLAATQDIAVDGWALTMLHRRNVGYSSTCNSIGQTVGYFLGYIVFMALESPEFCNSYLRSTPLPHGIVTLSSYLFFWACVFIVSTTLVALFKKEVSSTRLETRRDSTINLNVERAVPDQTQSQCTPTDIKESYTILLGILQLPPVYTLAMLLLTAKIGFAACDGVTHLKLMEAGIPKEKMALLAIPIVPLQMVLPLFISKYTTGRNPMNIYIKAYPYRLCMNIMIALMVWVTPKVLTWHESLPLYYYVSLVLIYCVEQVTVYSMFVATMAFFARISDPSVGGTYMTLLNTLSNLGTSWSTTTALWLVDSLTFKSCSVNNMQCNTPQSLQECTEANGTCVTTLDAYFIETAICTVLGVLWFLWANKKISSLQGLSKSAWLREWNRTAAHRNR